MQETYGQRSSRAAGSKRRALAFYFPVRICYMYLISKCIGQSDLGLYSTSLLAKRMRLHNGDLRWKNVFGCKICRKSPPRSGIVLASPKVVYIPRSDSSLHFDIRNISQIRIERLYASARRLLPAALLEHWPHVCRVKITFELLPTNWFVSTTRCHAL